MNKGKGIKYLFINAYYKENNKDDLKAFISNTDKLYELLENMDGLKSDLVRALQTEKEKLKILQRNAENSRRTRERKS